MNTPMTDFPRNEPGLVDSFLGTAYDTVKSVSDNLPELQRLDGVLDQIDEVAETTANRVVAEAMVPVQEILDNATASATASATAAAQSYNQTAGAVGVLRTEVFNKLSSSSVISVPTRDSLKSLSTLDHIAANVEGYSLRNDGGQSFWIYDVNSIEPESATSVAPNSGVGRWILNTTSFIRMSMFGAKGDGVTLDTTALVAAMAVAKANKQPLELEFGKNYLVGNIVDVSDSDLTIVGKGLITLAASTDTIEFHSTSSLVSLSSNISKGSNQITLSDVSGLVPGSLIYVQTTVNSGNPYGGIGTRQTFTVAGQILNTALPQITGNVVTVLEPSEWTFTTADAGLTVTVYKNPRKLTIDGLSIRRTYVTNNRAVSITGCRGVVNNLNLYNTVAPDPDNGQDGILITRSNNLQVLNPRFDNLRYAINLGDGSMNTLLHNVYGRRCRHVVYLNGWVVNTRIKGLSGENNNAIMDSHGSLNTSYEDVFTQSDRGFSNFRGDGGVMRNIDITTTAETAGDGFRVAQIQWGAAFAEQRNTRDLLIENVKITYPSTFVSANLTNIGYARNITIRNMQVFPVGPIVLGGAIGDIREVRLEDVNFDFSPTSGSSIRTPLYSNGNFNRGNRIPAVTSDNVNYTMLPYPVGVVNNLDLNFRGSLFRDTASVASRTFNIVIYPHPRPMNYLGVASIVGVIKLRLISNNFTISDYTLPFRFAFTGGSTGGAVGSLAGTTLVGTLIPLTLGSISSVTADKLWSITIPLTITRQATGQVFSVNYEVEAVGVAL